MLAAYAAEAQNYLRLGWPGPQWISQVRADFYVSETGEVTALCLTSGDEHLFRALTKTLPWSLSPSLVDGKPVRFILPLRVEVGTEMSPSPQLDTTMVADYVVMVS